MSRRLVSVAEHHNTASPIRPDPDLPWAGILAWAKETMEWQPGDWLTLLHNTLT